MGILIDNSQKLHKISTLKIRKTAQALLSALDSPDSELSLLITDDAGIEALNRQYRHREGPTNVLAFPMHEGDFSGINPELLGDVVISAETTAREAAELGVTFDRRFDFLLIHGILHLFGYDHERDEDAEAAMDRKTEKLFLMITEDK